MGHDVITHQSASLPDVVGGSARKPAAARNTADASVDCQGVSGMPLPTYGGAASGVRYAPLVRSHHGRTVRPIRAYDVPCVRPRARTRRMYARVIYLCASSSSAPFLDAGRR